MNKLSTHILGLFVLENIVFKDNRGGFQKIFSKNIFQENDLDSDFQEFYYSISNQNVIRGMHFQTPPYEHTKLVFVNQGSIVDVVLDLRKHSPTYGQFFCCELDAKDGKVLYIPKGLAHGFCAKEDNTIVNYMQTSVYNKEHDQGILYNSFGFNWQVNQPILSERDLSFETFEQFKTPFL
ncbi:MAG: dTDP-4-keto-6-deoxy-D-glucose epimerase [Bacteroidales bacterium]|nr:dTDP-4-keto-6-deoxy-D-glucose epimerase [Bacteroidales bacterium]